MSDNRICIFIDQDFHDNEEIWKLRINVPGIVPWKYKNPDGRISACAADFEENFLKKDWSREEVVEIGKKIAKMNKWMWEDISSPFEDNFREEWIDYSTGESNYYNLPE